MGSPIAYIFNQVSETVFQGGVNVPTGGKAHEPQGMIRCNSEADSKVWMKEDVLFKLLCCPVFHGSFFILEVF